MLLNLVGVWLVLFGVAVQVLVDVMLLPKIQHSGSLGLGLLGSFWCGGMWMGGKAGC